MDYIHWKWWQVVWLHFLVLPGPEFMRNVKIADFVPVPVVTFIPNKQIWHVVQTPDPWVSFPKHMVQLYNYVGVAIQLTKILPNSWSKSTIERSTPIAVYAGILSKLDFWWDFLSIESVPSNFLLWGQ